MTRRRSRYKDYCWENRTTLEIVLIVIILIAILLLITLSILILTHKSSIDNKICITSECISEASTILEEIDPNENLCSDFYKFSCKNIFEHDSIQKNLERELVELYQSPSQQEENRAIKLVKKIFKLCMTEKETDDDVIITVKKLISRLGGWPMLDGYNWDGKKFNWLHATYKLRDLGYPFGMFLDLTVDFDPENNNELVYTISIPREDNWINNLVYLKSKNLEKKIANKFKINFTNFKDELSEVILLMEQLKRLNYANVNFTNYERVKVSDLYENYNYINWMEYIKKIISPAEVSENDVVVFSQSHFIIDKWLKILLGTPKRTLANHMMLSIIEKTIPHLTKELQSVAGNRKEKHLKLCLKTAQSVFTPSPINVMYARKYMSSKIQKPVLAIVKNIIFSLRQEASNINWISKQNIYAIIKKLSEMAVIIGAPDNYMDDKLLSQFQFAETEGTSLSNLLAVGNKAQITKTFNEINKTRKELNLEKWFLGDSTDFNFYDEKNNVLRIPITVIPSMLYKDDLLKSLNYAVLGTGVAYKLTNIFREFLNTTEYYPITTSSCKNENSNPAEEFYFQEIFRTQLSLKVAYNAFKNSIGSSEREEQLIGLKYNLNHLFWIKTASTFCKNIEFYNIPNCKFYVTYGIMNNLDFASDFKCEILRIDYDVLC